MGSPAQFIEQSIASGIKQRSDRKQALSDTELEANIGDANDNINGFRAKLSQYAPGSTEHEQAKQGLTQALQARTQLFHPANNPTAMSKFGHMLLDQMPGKQPAAQPVPLNAPTVSATPAMQLGQATLPQGPAHTVQGPQTPQQLKAQAEANLIASSAPTPLPSALTSDETHAAERVKAGLDPRAAPAKPVAPVNKSALTPGTDGQGNAVMGYVEDGKFVPVEGTTVPTPKAAPHSNAALQTFIRTAYGETPTIEQMEEGIRRFKQLQTPDSTSTHQSLVFDQNNQGHLATLQSTTHKSFGGSSRSSSGSGETSSAPKKSGGSRSPIGPALEGIRKTTPAQNKAQTEYISAGKLKNVADDAWSHPSAVKDKQLALQIIRGSAGRVNMQEYNILTKQAGIANTLEAWANKATTGELPLNIRKQLVDAVHANYNAAEQARNESYEPIDVPTSGALKKKAQDNTQPKNAKDPLGIF